MTEYSEEKLNNLLSYKKFDLDGYRYSSSAEIKKEIPLEDIIHVPELTLKFETLEKILNKRGFKIVSK